MSATTYDFDTVIDRTGTVSQKWEKYAGRDIVPMWVADMDFRSPPEVLDALRARLDHGILGYAIPEAGMTAEVAAALSVRYGWTIHPDWVVWLPGVNVGMNLACRAIGGEGDAALTFTPIYPPFFTSSPNSARRLHRLPLLTDAAGHARIDFQALESLDDPGLRILLLCSPHNPVGRVWSRAELERLAAIALKKGWTIVSDEIHAELVLDGEHVSTGSLSPEIAQRTVTLVAPSKTFNLPGMTSAIAIIPDSDLRRRFVAAKRGLVGDYNILGMIAAHAAWTRGEPWRQSLLAYLRANRDHLQRRLQTEAPALRMGPVEATYLAWIDARALNLENPAAFFEQHGIGMNEGSTFGAPGFIRLNFGCPRSTLDLGINRLVAGVHAALQGRPTHED